MLLVVSAAVAAAAARLVIAACGADDPWREEALDPTWDLSLAELSA